MLQRSELPPLIPGVKGSCYRRDDPFAENAREDFAAIRMKVIERDHFTCVYCGLQTQGNEDAPGHTLEASGGLHVHHIDDDHNNNTEDNLISVCPLCHMVHHIGFAASRGYCHFIYLPEIRQEDLNILVHCIAVADARQCNSAEIENICRASWELYYVLNTFKRILVFNEDLNADTSMLGTALAGVLHERPDIYAQRAKGLHGIRVLFDFKALQLNFAHLSGWLPGPSWFTSWQRVYETMIRSAHE